MFYIINIIKNKKINNYYIRMVFLTLKEFKQFLKTLIRTNFLKTREDIKKFIIEIWLRHINKNSLLST
jgi:hypothetical protein